MAKQGKKSGSPKGGNVVGMSLCPVEGCGQKTTRAGFCAEHFIWFKAGLINRKGQKPKDFDKKHQAFLRKQRTAA